LVIEQRSMNNWTLRGFKDQLDCQVLRRGDDLQIYVSCYWVVTIGLITNTSSAWQQSPYECVKNNQR